MNRNDWKEKAQRLFFIYGYKTVDIAAELSLSRQTVANHLRSCAGYEDEQSRRKTANAAKRPAYKRRWAFGKEVGDLIAGATEKDCLRREHAEAVKTLSFERI